MSDSNRFDDFFVRGKYVVLKNHMYNYRLRKRAIEQTLGYDHPGLLLEIGSGISPIMTRSDRVVFSELSYFALATLKRMHARGHYVVADATRLPFKTESFHAAVASEVLEHIPDDAGAVRELARILKRDSPLVVTFPHRMMYFAADDEFVHHCRRYELSDMRARMVEVDLREVAVQKVLGPLEKVTMAIAVRFFHILDRIRPDANHSEAPSPWIHVAAPLFQFANTIYAGIAWLDARIAPRSLATVLLLKANKN